MRLNFIFLNKEKWIGFTISGGLHLGLAMTLITSGVHSPSLVIEQYHDLKLSIFQNVPSAHDIVSKEETIDDIEKIEEQETIKNPPDRTSQEISLTPKPLIKPVQEKAKILPPKAVQEKPAIVQTSNAAAVPKSGMIASEKARYQAEIYQKIMAKKYYPRRAKRFKKQGVVLIKFTLSPDGTIHHLHVIKTSGSISLDRAALKAVQKVGIFPPFPKNIQRASWVFEIPLEYEIT